jgi:hypothetical protein
VRANFSKKESFVMCGWPRKDGLASYCRQVRFCPRCNHVFRRQPILDEYGDAFSKGQEVWFLTLSFTRETDEKRRLVYKDLEERYWEQITERGAMDGCLYRKPALPFDSGADYLQCANYLKIMQHVMKEFSDAKRFRGAVGAAEVATWFQPLSVIPHMHYVVFASSFSEDDARDLRRRLKDLIRNSRQIADRMQPSVACYRLPASEDLRRVLGYCFKPVALNVAYKVALCRGEYSVRRLDALNEELNMFLEGFEVVFTEVLTVHRLGICNPCADEYCGIVTEERQEKREMEQERRRKRRKEASEGEAALSKAMRSRRGLERKATKVENRRALRRMEVPDESDGRHRAGGLRHRRRHQPPRSG